MLEYLLQNPFTCVGFIFASVVFLWFLYVNRDRDTPPGPLVYPIIGNINVLLSNGGDILKTLRNLRSKYGDLYSLKLGLFDVVVVNGHENLKDLLLKRGDEVSDRPNTFLFKDMFNHLGLVGSSGTLWKTHRTFALTTLRDFGVGKRNIESRIMEEMTMFIQNIESTNGEPFDPNDLVQTSISNIICSIVFNQRFEYTDKRFTKLLDLFNNIFKFTGPSTLISIFPFLKYVPGDPCNGQLLLSFNEQLMKFIQELVDEHNQTYDEDHIRDYIDAYLKEQKQNRDTFTDMQLGRSIFDLFAAGTETTATTIRWALVYLIHNDDIQSKMRKEIDDVVGTSRTPTLADRNNLPYCEAVISETLRRGNIAGIGPLHSCSQDVSFRGFKIKKGAMIVPNLDSVLNDPDVFEQPDVFNPERFINEDGKLKDQEKVVAFSVGRRVCLGESLARSELFLFLTSMIQRFRFVAKSENNLPPLDGILGLTHMPRPHEIRAIRRGFGNDILS